MCGLGKCTLSSSSTSSLRICHKPQKSHDFLQVLRIRREVATGPRTGISLEQDEHIGKQREVLSHRIEIQNFTLLYPEGNRLISSTNYYMLP